MENISQILYSKQVGSYQPVLDGVTFFSNAKRTLKETGFLIGNPKKTSQFFKYGSKIHITLLNFLWNWYTNDFRQFTIWNGRETNFFFKNAILILKCQNGIRRDRREHSRRILCSYFLKSQFWKFYESKYKMSTNSIMKPILIDNK